MINKNTNNEVEDKELLENDIDQENTDSQEFNQDNDQGDNQGDNPDLENLDDDEDTLPGFGDIELSDLDDDSDEVPQESPKDTKSLIGMLINKKYGQLKQDIEDIVAHKIAAKIHDKKSELMANGFRSVGQSLSPDKSDNEKSSE